jgi:hypothetical protein
VADVKNTEYDPNDPKSVQAMIAAQTLYEQQRTNEARNKRRKARKKHR